MPSWGLSLAGSPERLGRAGWCPPRGTGTSREGKGLSCIGENQTNMCKIVLQKKRKKFREEPAGGPKELEQERPGLSSVHAFSALFADHCFATPRVRSSSLHLTPSKLTCTGNHHLVLGRGWVVHSTPYSYCLCFLMRLQASWDRLCSLFSQAVKTGSNFMVSA